MPAADAPEAAAPGCTSMVITFCNRVWKSRAVPRLVPLAGSRLCPWSVIRPSQVWIGGAWAGQSDSRDLHSIPAITATLPGPHVPASGISAERNSMIGVLRHLLLDHVVALLQRKASLLIHMRCRMAASFRATATIAFLRSRRRERPRPQVLSVQGLALRLSKTTAAS